jgi:hypothetical protein
VKEVRDELAAYAQIAAYKKWIDINDKRTSTLRNSLIYDSGSGNTPTIVDIVREAQQKAPENTFLKFILPIPTTVKVAKKKQKNIKNRDLINTIEGKTRGKIEPDLLSTLMDSFSELFQNPATRYHAKALYDYLIVKDGLMFKNKSFIKMLPTVMFKEMSEATDMSTKLMAANSADEYKRILRDFSTQEIINAKGESVPYFTAQEKQTFNDLFRNKDLRAVKDALYKKVFGLNYYELYNRFEQIYATDIRNQFNLDLLRLRVKVGKGALKQADGITQVKAADTGDMYIHVTMFPEQLKKFPKGSEDRKKYFGHSMDELQAAGFAVSPHSVRDEEKPENNRTYLEFKKFMRTRDENGKYALYQLISLQRDDKIYSGPSMTVVGEYVPRGTYGVYRLIEPVGTANSVGVADLGPRPTKDQVLKTLESKIKRDNGDKGEAGAATTVTPTPTPTPGTSGGVISDESGTSLTHKQDEPITQQPMLGTETNTSGIPNDLLNNPLDLNPTNSPTGGIFGGLTQLPFNPDTDAPLGFISDEESDNTPC